MATFEAERKAYYEKQLADYRRSLDAEKAQLAAEINRLRAEYDSRLSQLEKERQQIVTDYQAREAALRVQLEQKTQVLEKANAQNSVNLETAQRQLAALGQRQDDIQAVSNQIDGQIGRINRDLGAGQTDAALADVHSLQAYLGQPTVRSVPQLADRVRSEVLLLQQLDVLLQDRARAQAATAGQSVTNDLERLVTIRSLAAKAATVTGPAQLDAYNQLVATMPEVQTAAAVLVDAAVKQAADDLQKKIRDQTQKSTAAAVQAMQAGDYAGALTQYRAALAASPDLAPDASRLLSDLLLLGYRISDYTRTGQAAPGTDQLAAQA
ncbi:MAG TPA: hypothetical protein VL359_02995, partial [bacterium]|nr:hypothetical protein [bacterium]